jgi:hypothetical protein
LKPLVAILLVLLLGAVPAARALAPAEGDDPEPPTELPESQLLYQQALQSIAEGRKNDASETLNRVVEQEPLHAGAWLDLALIQCALGHADAAERMFSSIIERFAPPPGILEMIADARRNGCARWRPHSQASLSFGRGIDQNVNQGSSSNTYSTTLTGVAVELPLSEDFLPKHDQYSVLSADYISDLTPNGSIGYVQLQSRRYDTLGQYNTSSLFFGVDTPWRYGNWTLHGSATAGLVTLDHQLYQRQTQLQARVGPPLPLPAKLQFSVAASLTHVDFVTLHNFDANTAELRGQFNYRLKDGSALASMAWLNDRATGERPGGNRHGWLATLQWRQQLWGGATGEVGYTRQLWRSASDYSPGFINVVRDQLTQVLRASVSYPLTASQSLQLEARQVRNKENISIFQYNDRQLQLSWQWQGL